MGPKNSPENAEMIDDPLHFANVFDASAGRVGYEGFLLGAPRPSHLRDTTITSTQAVPPDEVLFRRRNAPVRYEEDNIYSAHWDLSKDQKLPDSDVLKTLHEYCSDFYASGAVDNAAHSFHSMDETALLALGILIEEAAAVKLGKTGDLALVEEAEGEPRSTMAENMYWTGQAWRRSVISNHAMPKSKNPSGIRFRERSASKSRSGSRPTRK